ncbi:MAG: hypothetical protein AAF846_26330 [Chloroflexota bacterium]
MKTKSDKNNNIFELANPETQFGQIDTFTSSHNVFSVRITDRKLLPVTKLIFNRTLYHEGPMYWKGVNFRVGDINEFSYLKQCHGFTEDYILFIATTEQNIDIKILAFMAYRLEGKEETVEIHPLNVEKYIK